MFRVNQRARQTESPQLASELDKLLAKYQSIANSDPLQLRSLIPPQELWRLFVDGVKQHRGWQSFEINEPGYLKALYLAFDKLFEQAVVLSADLILSMHRHAMENVRDTNYERERTRHKDHEANQPGNFRQAEPVDYSIGGYFFSASNTKAIGTATCSGIKEYIQKDDKKNSWHAFSLYYRSRHTSTFEDVIISKEFVMKARQCRNIRCDEKLIEAMRDFIYFDIYNLLMFVDYKFDDRRMKGLANFIRAVGRTKDDDGLAKIIHTIACGIEAPFGAYGILAISAQRINTPEQLYNDVNALIATYHSEIIKTHTHEGRLRTITNLVQSLEQLHPFMDGNCRTFCMLLLNYLLIHNGFPLVICEDPNRFDLHSKDELFKEVIQGMKNTFSLIEEKELFNYRTVVDDGHGDYFLTITATEIMRRRARLNKENETTKDHTNTQHANTFRL